MKVFLFLMLLSNSAIAAEETIIRQNLPNSSVPDYREPALVKDGDTTHRALPNSTFTDYREPGYVTKGDKVYQTLPNSNMPDYRKPSYTIQKGASSSGKK